ncbi:MAG: hypothetical protein OM95_08755 [Bdellovibrio sp. ArHS]|uniref:hypothetical protein n=1 Tax=Bdellovibrio sp. ArHS TaxID=1569284 RepID=UPI0005830A0C|nr:hypothetical protein [Bdellovibrio sp. ArHS]KHD88580.1 MAG: hypothetical protein OM95_08755 [Bdellovibrio sp. ArHS]
MKFLVMLLSFLVLSSGVFAQNKFYKSTDKMTLSYEEFRGLSEANQKAWLNEIRAFYAKIDAVEAGERINLKRKYSLLPDFLFKAVATSRVLCAATSFFQGLPTQAADERCQVHRSVKMAVSLVCLRCPGDRLSGVNVCTSANDDAATISKNLLGELEKKSYEGAKVQISADQLAKHVEVTLDEGSSPFAAPVLRKETVVKRIVTPASSEEVVIDLGPQAQIQKASKTEPLTVVERRDSSGAVLDRVGNNPHVSDFHLRSLEDVGSLKGNDNLDVEEVVKTEHLACVYAGWAVEGPQCSPISEKEIRDASGKLVTYSCKNQKSETTIYGDNEEGKAIVLCNPVLFGLKEDKPICIRRSKNATEECVKASNKASETLAFAKSNPQEYRALVRRVDVLCQQDESVLRKHFEKRGRSKSQVDYAIKDLSATCIHLRGRMAELVDANKATAPRAGQR